MRHKYLTLHNFYYRLLRQKQGELRLLIRKLGLPMGPLYHSFPK